MSPPRSLVPGCRRADPTARTVAPPGVRQRGAELASLAWSSWLLAAPHARPLTDFGIAFGAAALGFARADGRPLVAWAGLAVGYVARPKTWVVPADQPRGHRRRRMRSAAPADAVTALLPGAVLVDVHDRDRRMFAILAWRDFRAVVLAVDAPADPVVSLSQPVRVRCPTSRPYPLDRAQPALRASGVRGVAGPAAGCDWPSGHDVARRRVRHGGGHGRQRGDRGSRRRIARHDSADGGRRPTRAAGTGLGGGGVTPADRDGAARGGRIQRWPPPRPAVSDGRT